MKTLRFTIVIASLLCSLALAAQSTLMHTMPAAGEVPEINEIHLYFDGEWERGSKPSAKITLSGPDGYFVPSMQNYSNGEFVVIYIGEDAVITSPGEYVLTIPAAKYKVDGKDIEQTEFVYTISGETAEFPEYTVSPTPGKYTELDGQFSITFDTDQAISVTEGQIGLFGPDGDINVAVTVADDAPRVDIQAVNAAGTAIQLSDEGEYYLSVPYGAIQAGDTYNTSRILLTYNISRGIVGNWTGEVVATPADGSTVESLRNISVVYTGAGTVRVNEHASGANFPVMRNTTTGTTTSCMVLAEGNVLNISLISEVTAGGEYQQEIPTRIVTVDGEYPDSPIYLHYTIPQTQAAFEYTYTTDPADGATIGNDRLIVIAFAADDLASIAHNPYAWGAEAPHFTNTRGDYNPSLVATDNGLSSILTHTWPFENDGEYTLVIPAGYYTLTRADGATVDNTEIRINYNVLLSGISGVSVDTHTFEIYNLQGVRMTSGTRLPAGIYIVNGKATYLPAK